MIFDELSFLGEVTTNVSSRLSYSQLKLTTIMFNLGCASISDKPVYSMEATTIRIKWEFQVITKMMETTEVMKIIIA